MGSTGYLYTQTITVKQADVHHSYVPSCEIDHKNCGWHNASLRQFKWIYKVIPSRRAINFVILSFGYTNASIDGITLIVMKC